MGILFKNLSMPKTCWDCNLFNHMHAYSKELKIDTWYGICSGFDSDYKEIPEEVYRNTRPDWCPATEIKEEV